MDQKAKFLRCAEELKPRLFCSVCRPIRVISGKADKGRAKEHAPFSYRSRPLHAGESICLDFGNHFVGQIGFRFSYSGKHPDAPAWLRFQFAERLEEFSEDIDAYNGWISKSWIQLEQIHLDELPTEILLPRRYAFRYVKITVLDVSSRYALTVEDCFCRESTSADDTAVSFPDFGDPLLNKIDRTAVRTLRNCMQDVFEDGPKRDRRLWLGDLHLQAKVNYVSYKNYDLVKRCLYLFAGSAKSDGRLSSNIFLRPGIAADDAYMFDYALFFISTLKDYVCASDDQETLRALYPCAERQIEIARRAFSDTGCIKDSDRLGWCFTDWNLDLNKQASAQGIYLYCLRDFALLSRMLGKQAVLPLLKEEYENKKEAALQCFYNKDFRLFTSGASAQISWASQIWMVLAGVVEGDEARRLLLRPEKFPDAVHIVTPYLYHFYIQALYTVGLEEKALEKIKAYWGGMIAQGADTFWELYDPADPAASPYGGTIVNSYCHAWSCTPAYFLRKYKDPGNV